MKMTNQTYENKKKMSAKRVVFILSFVILPTINFLIFYVFVNVNSFVMAFLKTIDGRTMFTLDNFTMFFSELSKKTSLIRQAFRNTSITFLVNEVMFVVGFFVSFFLYKKIAGHRFFKIVFMLPSIIAGTIVASVFTTFVGVEGPIVKLMKLFKEYEFVPELLADSDYANKTILANLIWLSFPGSLVIWSGTFSRIPESVIESGKLDGVSWLKEAIYLVIPLVWPTFALQFLLTICGFFGASGQVFLLTRGESGTMTLSAWMYLQVLDNKAEAMNNSNAFNYLSAVGLMLTTVSIIVTVFIRKYTNRAFGGGVQY